MRIKLSLLLLIYLSTYLPLTCNSQNEDKDFITNCLHGKIKYPWRLQLMKIEGRVIVELKTDNSGYVESINVKSDYFGKTNDYEEITDPGKIEKLKSIVSRKITPVFSNCVKNHQFSKTNYTFEIPVSFGIYETDDDYSIYDDDYEYDYEEQFDYRHEYD